MSWYCLQYVSSYPGRPSNWAGPLHLDESEAGLWYQNAVESHPNQSVRLWKWTGGRWGAAYV